MLTNAKRMTPELRKQYIIEQGLKLANDSHYLLITREQVACACKLSPGIINRYFGGIDNLKHEVLRLAIERKSIAIVAQAMVQHDPLVKDIDPDLRNEAIAYIEG